VRLLLENGESVVLFGWHRSVYDIWVERLKEFSPVLYTGSENAAQKADSVERFTTGKSKLFIMSLRSGAGVDGLQHVCRTVVVGELDWAPGVIEQCIGRVDRDGQTNPVMAYYMLAADGADPIMADVLGIKREQVEGVRNPGSDLIERLETGEDHIRRLAKELLLSRGETIPGEPSITEIHSVTSIRAQSVETLVS
jgi:SNF2 family DNA or RNA helicase